MQEAQMDHERKTLERVQGDQHVEADLATKERMHAAEVAAKERMHNRALESKEKVAALDRKMKETQAKADRVAAKKKPAAKK
jgi:hypothetical protein